jgi:hypothetical protein
MNPLRLPPIAANEAQLEVLEVAKHHKGGGSVRRIAGEMSLSRCAVTTIV